MAISKTDIANMALMKLGDKPRRVSSFANDTSATAQTIRDVYEMSLDEAIARLDWSCLRKVVALTQSDDDPTITSWQYKYPRPDDCRVFRKVIDTDGTEYAFEEYVEADGDDNDAYIYTNLESAYAVYSYLNDDPDTYSVGLRNMLIWTVADKIALSISTPKIAASVAISLQNYADRGARAAEQAERYVEAEAGSDDWTSVY